jgi:four helix bundle protein
VSYRDLQIWVLAKSIAVEIHDMTLNELPKFEQYETGSQIRRSSKSTLSNIVEGYGRRAYKQDFLRFLHYSLASNLETMSHLEILYETKSLENEKLYSALVEQIDQLGRKLNLFIRAVQLKHLSAKEPEAEYLTSNIEDQTSSIDDLKPE